VRVTSVEVEVGARPEVEEVAPTLAASVLEALGEIG